MSRKNALLKVLMAGLLFSACNRNLLNKNDGLKNQSLESIEKAANEPTVTMGPVEHYKAEDENIVNAAQSDDSSSDDANTVLGEQNMFVIETISQEIKDRINGKSYGKDCTVPYEDLRYVKVLYWGFDDQSHEGELIVNKAIAEDIVEIFKELYENKYPIEKMVLVDEYDADDNASMAANNTSAFNFRLIDNGSGRLSKHSYGLAIDINPLYNPYVRKINGKTVVSPENGEKYADRSLDCPYFIKKDDICYKAFTSRGFTWGGEWKNSKDYQHFEKDID